MKRLILVWLLILFSSISANPTTAQDNAPYQVFVTRGGDGSRLTFVNMLTGQEINTAVTGERFTILRDGVLYFDRAANRVKIATPQGDIIDHPFIQPTPEARRIDWLVTPNYRRIAWTVTTGTSNALTTTTTIANIDGTDPLTILIDGTRDGIRAMPIAFNPEETHLYMDYQPDTIGDLTPYRQYAGLFSVDLATGETEMLPNEPGCFCGAGVDAGQFLRLAVSADLAGFAVNITNLQNGATHTIPALARSGYTQSGDVILSPDGEKAVYALAQVRNFGSPQQEIHSIFVLVDLVNNQQTALTEPITTFVRPIAWTEQNSAILFTSPTLDGTWKVSLDNGALIKVANATYIGVIDKPAAFN